MDPMRCVLRLGGVLYVVLEHRTLHCSDWNMKDEKVGSHRVIISTQSLVGRVPCAALRVQVHYASREYRSAAQSE